MTTDLIFEEPPATPRGGRPVGSSPAARWTATLRNYPDAWAKYPTPWNNKGTAHAKASAIRNGKVYGIAKGDYEALAATIDGKTYLYARFVGAASGGAA